MYDSGSPIETNGGRIVFFCPDLSIDTPGFLCVLFVGGTYSVLTVNVNYSLHM